MDEPTTATPRGLTPRRRRAANLAAAHLLLELRAQLHPRLVNTGRMHGPKTAAHAYRHALAEEVSS